MDNPTWRLTNIADVHEPTADTLYLTGSVESLDAIRRFIEQRAGALGAGPAATADLVLAVDEAASNVFLHGYAGRPGQVAVAVQRERDAVVVRLQDAAPPFDPTSVPPPDLGLPPDERAPGGLGMHLIRQVVDEVRYRALPGGGNELALVKRIDRG